jgi:hypothetical protein
MKNKYFITTIVLLSFAIACKNEEKKVEPVKTTVASTLVGNFVTAEYEKRADGYDWVGVMISKTSDSTAHISVRSRVDKKKATCSFDAEGKFIGSDTLSANYEGKIILFVFDGKALQINTANKADSNLLNYFCSGGASLAGTYHKINEPLDKTQLDTTVSKN